MRGGRRAPEALRMPIEGEGITHPREPEGWGAGLTLVEELLLTHAPEVAQFPPLLRTITRLCARSTRISRAGDRVVRYSFQRSCRV
jgi:hypothetical protein